MKVYTLSGGSSWAVNKEGARRVLEGTEQSQDRSHLCEDSGNKHDDDETPKLFLGERTVLRGSDMPW